jgi:hypothetical protein
VQRKQKAKVEFEQVIGQEHVPSSKERLRGAHYSALIQDLLQLWSVAGKDGHNLELYKEEHAGRLACNLGRELTIDERNQINVTGVSQLKKSTCADERTNYSIEYENGSIPGCTGTMINSSGPDSPSEGTGQSI